MTAALIAINVAVWLFYELPDLDHAVNQLAYHPCELENSCPTVGEDWHVTALTSMFMHGSWLHLIGNMLFLWIFGNNVEDILGRIGYIVFYLLAGYAATALQTIVTLETSPGSADIPNLGASGAISGVLGASGAISGVLGAYLIFLPHASVLTVIILGFIFFLREIPAVFFLGVYLFFQLWQAGFQFTHPPE
ncbi:MAG: rhomboid family intramembrane serine protease, partial [Gaiellaceae bacterium]